MVTEPRTTVLYAEPPYKAIYSFSQLGEVGKLELAGHHVGRLRNGQAERTSWVGS